MYARVQQVMAQFVLKIEKLSHIMGPTPILEMIQKNKRCKQKIIEETVLIWFTFKPGLELTGFRTTGVLLLTS